MRSPPVWVERHLHGHREHLERRLSGAVFAPGVGADVAVFPPAATTDGDALLALGPKPVQIRKVDVTRFRPSQASGPCNRYLAGGWPKRRLSGCTGRAASGRHYRSYGAPAGLGVTVLRLLIRIRRPSDVCQP